MIQPTKKETRLLEVCREQNIHVELIVAIIEENYRRELEHPEYSAADRSRYAELYITFSELYRDLVLNPDQYKD